MLEVHLARGFFGRFMGVRGLPVAEPGVVRALVLKPCLAVHTLGLREPIDVVFLGAGNQILRHVPRVAPNRIVMDRRARAVVELPAGYCAGSSWAMALSCALCDSKIIM